VGGGGEVAMGAAWVRGPGVVTQPRPTNT